MDKKKKKYLSCGAVVFCLGLVLLINGIGARKGQAQESDADKSGGTVSANVEENDGQDRENTVLSAAIVPFQEGEGWIADSSESMIVYEDKLYTYTDYAVYCYDIQTQSLQELLRTGEYVRGFGIAGDYLYIMTTVTGNGVEDWVLMRIDLGTSECKQIELSGEQSDSRLWIYGDILYFASYESDDVAAYAVLEDGSIGERLKDSRNVFNSIPEGGTPVCPAPVMMEHFGYLLLRREDSGSLWAYKPSEELWQELALPAAIQIQAVGDRRMIGRVWSYEAEDGIDRWYNINLVDGTAEELLLGRRDDWNRLLSMQGDLLYYCNNHTVKSMLLTDGTTADYFMRIENPGAYEEMMAGEYHYTKPVDNDYEDEWIVQRRMPECRGTGQEGQAVRILLENHHICELAEVEEWKREVVCPVCNEIYRIEIDARLKLNRNTPAAEQIRSVLDKDYTDWQAGVDEDWEGDWRQADRKDHEAGSCYDSFSQAPGAQNTYMSYRENISYADSRYICIRMDYYDEIRFAVHGIGWIRYKLFDRVTGKELKLQDIIDCTQEEWRKLAMDAFRYNKWCSEYFAEHEEEVDYDLKWGLGRRGLIIHFDSYEIASYASGMPEAVIAYEDLPLKIDLHPEEFLSLIPIGDSPQ